MSPRPRKVTDSQLFSAMQAVMNRVGPRDLTLAAIAREAGVTAAVIVQRFGSKRAMLRAAAEKFAEGSEEFIGEQMRRHASPLKALRAYADCMAGMAVSPTALVRNLAYLQDDLTDPVLYKHLRKHARATRAAFQKLLEAAKDAGELVPNTDARQLARTIEAVISGSMLSWAVHREGSAAGWMRKDLEAVLAPYLKAGLGAIRGRRRR
jgi:AcrR family transcriptional regulator